MWLIYYNFYFLIVLLSFFLKPFYLLPNSPDINYCGFEQSCKRSESDVELQANSCCTPCDCLDVCKEKGTCCHDKEGINETRNIITQECIPALYIPDDVLDYSLYVSSYFVRTRCPVTFNDKYIRDKCENPKPKSLQELVFVSSKDGKIIYKNKFCGLCNKEKDVTAWEMNAYRHNRCWTIISEENINLESLEKLILSSCTLTFKRPSNVDLKSVRCYEENEVIDKCNATGRWDVYDKGTEQLCLNPPESVYFIKSKVYKNLYCYLCNTYIKPEKCTSAGERIPTDHTVKLVNLIDWAYHDSTDENQCRTDEIFDTFFSRCKTLYCPDLSIAVNGQCIPFLDVYQSYVLILRLVPLEIVIKTESLKTALSYQLPKIRRQLGFGECELFYGVLYIEENNSGADLEEINIQMALKQTKECSLGSIWSKFTLLERNTTKIALTLNKRNICFTVFWNNELILPETKYDVIYTYGNYSNKNGHRLYQYIESGMFCPKVLLTRTEYKTVIRNHSHVNDLLFTPKTDDTNSSVFVCVDNYLSGEPLAVGQTNILYHFSIVMSFLYLVI